jgi:hypothetical protein
VHQVEQERAARVKAERQFTLARTQNTRLRAALARLKAEQKAADNPEVSA